MTDLPKRNRLVTGFLFGLTIGVTAITGGALLLKPKPLIMVVPQTKVIQQKVIVKVPVKLTIEDKKQINCIATNITYEADNQPTEGKIAVANVVMNRTHDPRFANNACSVVKQKISGVYQFSWMRESNKRHKFHYMETNRKIAEQVYIGNIQDNTGGAKFYHATWCHPHWRLAKTVTIGQHIFYRG